jgi:hypothetical protein
VSNPGLAPRRPRCAVCREVLAIEDVSWRLLDVDGKRIPDGLVRAKDYCRSVGMEGTQQRLHNAVVRHRGHIEKWLARQGRRDDAMVPLEGEDDKVTVLAPAGPVRWLDVNATAMEVGNDAFRHIKDRMERDLLDDPALIRVASLGVSAAHKRGDLETKGRKLSQVDELLKLASGVPRPNPA